MTLNDQSNKNLNIQTEFFLAFILATLAALSIKLPELFGIDMDQNESFYARNISLFVLPLLSGYFAWKRQIKTQTLILLALAFVAAGVFANVYPFEQGADTGNLLAVHLPIALWLLVGIVHSGGRWGEIAGRMDFIRFSGELFIYYVLIALGGGVFTAFMALIFGTIDVDIEPFFESWLLPCGATGAVIIASWLVDTRKNLTENFAPLLARLFSPFFAIMLVTFLAVLLWSGRDLVIDRNVLIAFDMLLVVVLGLLLYGISARDPHLPPGVFDVVQVVLVVGALLADIVALWAISERITEFGLTPNRIAALGMNIILLINLTWSLLLYIRFLRGYVQFQVLEKWQTDYLPVYAYWAAIVVIIFPPLFGFQ